MRFAKDENSSPRGYVPRSRSQRGGSNEKSSWRIIFREKLLRRHPVLQFEICPCETAEVARGPDRRILRAGRYNKRYEERRGASRASQRKSSPSRPVYIREAWHVYLCDMTGKERKRKEIAAPAGCHGIFRHGPAFRIFVLTCDTRTFVRRNEATRENDVQRALTCCG